VVRHTEIAAQTQTQCSIDTDNTDFNKQHRYPQTTTQISVTQLVMHGSSNKTHLTAAEMMTNVRETNITYAATHNTTNLRY